MIVFPAPQRASGPRGHGHGSHGQTPGHRQVPGHGQMPSHSQVPGQGQIPGHGQKPAMASQPNMQQYSNYQPSYAYDYPNYQQDAAGPLLSTPVNSADDQQAATSEGGNFGTFVVFALIFIVLIIGAVVYVRKEFMKSQPEGGERVPSENTKM